MVTNILFYAMLIVSILTNIILSKKLSKSMDLKEALMYSYKTQGTCSREILFDVQDNVVTKVQYIGGCNGNTQGVAALCEGRPVDELISILSGIDCNGRGTSCPDQLAKALVKYKESV